MRDRHLKNGSASPALKICFKFELKIELTFQECIGFCNESMLNAGRIPYNRLEMKLHPVTGKLARKDLPELLYKAGLAFTAVLLLVQAALWVGLENTSARVALNDWFCLLASAAALAAMLYAVHWSRRLDQRLGRAWSWFAMAMLAWVAGDLTWIIIELFLDSAPYPSLADLFYLLAYPLFLTGILVFPRQPGDRKVTWVWLDVFIILFSAFGVYWNLMLADQLPEAPSLLHALLAAACPFGDVMLILTITLILFQPRFPQWMVPFMWILGGLVSSAIGDAVLSVALVHQTFNSSLIFNLIFSLSPLLMMVSGLSQAVHVQRTIHQSRTVPLQRIEEPLRLVRLLAPFFWLLLTYILIHANNLAIPSKTYTITEDWIGLIIVLMVVREALVILDNDRLTRELRGLNDQLEKRVAERASSLAVANYELRREMDERSRVEAVLREREEKLAHFALYDSLTGLPNRSLLLDRLSQALQRSLRHPDERYAVLFLDFDSFKVVNDSLGHLAGDQLLIQIGQRLTSLVRGSDTVARLGGDEFIVLLEGFRAEGFVLATAQRLLDAFLDPFALSGHTIYISASIGVVISGTGYQNAVEIIRDADLAMYAAKTSGKARFTLFVPELRHSALNRLTLEAELHHALDWHELTLHYQPIYELKTGRLSGLEALVRWHHPTRGLIGPGEFLSVAETSGFIITMTHWLLYEACRQLAEWQAQLPPDRPRLTLSINLSPNCLRHPELVQWVEQVLHLYPILPQQLHMEIVETILLEDVELARRIFSDLRRMGIKVSLDDFGVGYSSLNYLTQYPIDILKIDRSFVSRTLDATDAASVVRAISSLASELEIEVVAEGVETREQLIFVREAGCQYGQGNFLAAALSVDGVNALLAEEKAVLV